LKDAEASLETSFGMIRSSWKRSDGKIIYDFTVPVGTTAELILPGERPVMLKAGTHHFVR
jgi:alpha-L-rhamnosidase